MRTEGKERWRELCERIAVEQDGDKFLAAIQELNQVLANDEKRLRHIFAPSRDQRNKELDYS